MRSSQDLSDVRYTPRTVDLEQSNALYDRVYAYNIYLQLKGPLLLSIVGRRRSPPAHVLSVKVGDAMEKSKLEVIQDDILAVKHALANNIAYEGLQGDQLTTVLSTLFSQRAQQTIAAAAAAATTSGGSGGSEPASFAAAAAASPQDNGATGMSRVPVNGSRAKAVSAKKKSPKKPTTTTTPATTSDPANDDQSTPTAASTDSPKTQQTKDKEATPNNKTPPPKSKPPKRKHKPAPSPAQQKEKPAAKKRKKSLGEVLRELRKSIKVGDFVSVLGDVLVRGTWEKVWIKGEVVREVSQQQQSLHPGANLVLLLS